MVVGQKLSPLDTALAIAAAIIGLAAVGTTVYVLQLFGN